MSEAIKGPMLDAHHHLWDPARADYPWLAGAYAPLRRRFGPEDLAPNLLAADVDRTILVQTRSSLAETRDFLATAAATPFIAGVIGWVDLTSPAVADTIAELRAGPGGDRLVGIRHQVHDEPDPEWLVRADVQRGLATVAGAGLVYDLLVRPRELPTALAVARAHPRARFVIDHLAKPPIASGELEPWARLIAAFGPLEHVAVKLSGLVTEADWGSWTIADLRPYVDRALAIFGPDRLVFGSDWPVCLVAAPYEEVVGVARTLTANLSVTERAAIFGTTAAGVYGLG
jgi:L-fuconolactonase